MSNRQRRQRPRILFVDDEPRILDGLRRMLRRQRRTWELSFATSAAEAVNLMEQAPYDLVVSDMRMPEMDGAELLSHVAEHYPDTIRFVLSGFSEREAAVRAESSAHQFLSKPCEASVLEKELNQALCFRHLVENELLRRIVSQIDSLPSLPQLYQEICRIAGSDKDGVKEAAAIVAKDIGMSAKLLQLVNSSFFALRREVSSVQQAVSLLGIETLKSLVLATGIFKDLCFSQSRLPGFSQDRLWEHCTQCGALAKQIVLTETDDEQMAEHALSAGVLHDLGKLILAAKLPEIFEDTYQTARNEKNTFCAVEMECEGVSHAEIGAYLLGLWRLPLPVIQAVAFHHAPEASGCESLNATLAVYAANILVQERTPSVSGNGTVPEFNRGFLAAIGFENRIESWRNIEWAE